jgi:hypothetical protein
LSGGGARFDGAVAPVLDVINRFSHRRVYATRRSGKPPNSFPVRLKRRLASGRWPPLRTQLHRPGFLDLSR